MFYIYLFVLSAGIYFMLMHFPFAGLLLFSSMVVLLIHFIWQFWKVKSIKSPFVWLSLSSLFGGVFYFLKVLFIPETTLWFMLFAVSLGVSLYLFYKKREPQSLSSKLQFLFGIIIAIHFFMSESSVILLYTLEDPYDENARIMSSKVQFLAYSYYLEGDSEKSEQLILRNIRHLTNEIKRCDDSLVLSDLSFNLKQSEQDLISVRKNQWENLVPLIPTDVYSPIEE